MSDPQNDWQLLLEKIAIRIKIGLGLTQALLQSASFVTGENLRRDGGVHAGRK